MIPEKKSTQDRPSVQVYHDHDISSNLHNKKKKLYESINSFDSDEDNDGDNKTYQEKIWEFTDKRKVHSTATISSIRADPKFCLFINTFMLHNSYAYIMFCFKG
jgi:hypothetical protein